jgi:hypothetical protein
MLEIELGPEGVRDRRLTVEGDDCACPGGWTRPWPTGDAGKERKAVTSELRRSDVNSGRRLRRIPRHERARSSPEDMGRWCPFWEREVGEYSRLQVQHRAD